MKFIFFPIFITLVGCVPSSCTEASRKMQLKEYEKSIQSGTEMIQRAQTDSERAQGHALRGWGLSEKGRYSRFFKIISPSEYENVFTQAIHNYDQALLFSPQGAPYYFGRGRAYYARAFQGDPLLKPEKEFGVRAEADFSRALELDENNLEALDFRGLTRMALENWDGAIVDFENLQRRDLKRGRPRLADALCLRGMELQKSGKPDLALADYERSLVTDADRDGCSCDPRGPLAGLKKQKVESK